MTCIVIISILLKNNNFLESIHSVICNIILLYGTHVPILLLFFFLLVGFGLLSTVKSQLLKSKKKKKKPVVTSRLLFGVVDMNRNFFENISYVYYNHIVVGK